MAEASADPHSHFSEDLASELEALRSIFGGDGEFEVQELPPGSEYCCVVQVKPEGLAVGLKFSLPDTYPDKSPKVEILPTEKNVMLLNDDPILTELLQLLYQSAQEADGEPMMYRLIDIAREWLEGRSLEGEGADEDDDEQEESANKEETAQSLTHKRNKKPTKLDADEEEDYKKKGKKKKKKKPAEDNQGPVKKSRMKTASEVISRIQWDKQVRKEDFIVGYLDRFRGVIEKPFTTFSWVDIATVDDYDSLAIPRHRIQYFKYKDRVVWDKNERLDDVFGSTGSKKTILDTVEVFSKENQSVEEKEASDAVGDDSVVQEATEESDLVQEAKSEEKRRRPSRRPNYFLAIRVTDPVIRRCVRRIQDALCDDDPRLDSSRTDLDSLHITLCTMRLDSQDDMSKAIDVLKSLQRDISELLSPVTMLRFQGLDQFHGRVLFSPPEECPALIKLSQMLQAALGEAGINLVGNRPQFNPHMTIFKMRREEADDFDGTPLRSYLYERFSQAFLGVQPIEAVHLCSMDDPHRADGFYYCLASMDIQSEH
ncbi:uncharacterized protein LOC119735556 [Patiria miniata]|uniref:RWD domain-containing protein n=1 Tax=Patiria miniata TaxID=46514 RepID=A0A914AN93_PATMI|nr:uncharacterized protein LOC119735556 [Patiria miniata]XP_038065222.1 uncharacterized protein LOC119735556 [Patiria miniata]